MLALLQGRAFARGFAALALLALGWGAWRGAPELAAAAGRLAARPALTLLALFAYLGFVVQLGAAWRSLLLRLGGGPCGWREALAVQSVAWSARYLPGKVGLAAAKALLPPGPRGAALWAVAYEQLLFLVAGAAVLAACAAGALALRDALLPGAAPLIAGAVAVLALLAVARFAPRLDAWVARRAGGAPPSAHPTAPELAYRTLGFAGAHLTVGAGFVALLHALGHGAALSPLHAIGVLTAAHLGGIVAVFAPAGLGVRDLLLAVLLAPTLGPAEAGAVAVLTRAWATLGDLLFAPVALLRR